MGFKVSQLPLQRGFEQAISVAFQEKQILANWHAQLAGNITGIDAMNMMANLTRVIDSLNGVATLPGIGDYAQTQFGDVTYDVAAEFTAMLNALTAIKNWLVANIPQNAVTIVNGVLTGATYTPAQTAALRTLVSQAQATIE